jgi:RND family efflux transporter MFP subunit
MDNCERKTLEGHTATSLWATALQILVAVILLLAGIAGARLLILSKKPPTKAEQAHMAPLVEVERLAKRDIAMTIRGFGSVRPKVQVEIVPQVAGNIVEIHQNFKPGGFIRAGEVIFKIDPRDYELAVQQAHAIVADAQVKLDLQKAEAQVAKSEWKQLNPDTDPPSPLVFREPYVRQAQAALDSANAQLAKAQLNLERTRVSLPIDTVILSEKVDLGQYAGIGQPLGSAHGIELVEIEVPLEDRELAWLSIPANPAPINGEASGGERSKAQVICEFAGREQTWTGYVTRTTGQVDTASRLVSVVVEVPKPFGGSDGKPPLVPGMFVEVLIKGNTLKDAIAVPRDAIHSADNVWIVRDGSLHIKKIQIARTDEGVAYVTSGVEDGDDIIISALDTATNGMKVRTETEVSANQGQPEAGNTN